MLQMQITFIILFIVVTFDKINCLSSEVNEKEIGNKTRELEFKIRDGTVKGNSPGEAKSRTKRWIEETIKTPSGALVFISSPEVRRAKCGERQWAKLIYLHKYGTMGSKEFKLVSDAIKQSKPKLCFKIFKIQKVKNNCLWDWYKSRREDIMNNSNVTDANERLLFYGTDDVWQIIRMGFDERLTTGGTFGAGIYFTDQFSVAHAKAVNKTCQSCVRKMLLSRVILGKQYTQSVSKLHAHPPVGFDSVLGTQSGVAHDDYVIYRGEQAYPEFVISYKTCSALLRG